MARRRRIDRELHDLQLKIDGIFSGTPLAIVGDCLNGYISETLEVIKSGDARPGQDANVVEHCTSLLDQLPNSFGPRFNVDAAIISSIADEWSMGHVRLSGFIVPRYSRDWGHLTVTLSTNKYQGHAIDVILLPGRDDLSSLDLLDYPWLCHEVGHNLHFQTKALASSFEPLLTKRLTALSLRALADTGAAIANSISVIDRIREYWTPTLNHRNWPYEIAVDVTALWSCGPAYLDSFHQMLHDHRPNPYFLTQAHPPYKVRVDALVDAAQRLGWGNYTKSLEAILQSWQSADPFENRDNLYVAIADEELAVSAVTCALQVCNDLAVPRLTCERMDAIRQSVRQGTIPEFGIDLIIAAWSAEQEMHDDAYDRWHADVLAALSELITLECR